MFFSTTLPGPSEVIIHQSLMDSHLGRGPLQRSAFKTYFRTATQAGWKKSRRPEGLSSWMLLFVAHVSAIVLGLEGGMSYSFLGLLSKFAWRSLEQRWKQDKVKSEWEGLEILVYSLFCYSKTSMLLKNIKMWLPYHTDIADIAGMFTVCFKFSWSQEGWIKGCALAFRHFLRCWKESKGSSKMDTWNCPFFGGYLVLLKVRFFAFLKGLLFFWKGPSLNKPKFWVII